jgi:capsular polysaccharide transport system ATP-binding protein
MSGAALAEAASSPGLRVQNLGMTYHGAPRPLFQGLSFDLARGGRLAILGRNGQGKSTLIKMLGGVLPETEGRIQWLMSSSWPIGFGGGFQGSLSGLDNIKFLSRLYARPYAEVLQRVDEFAELGSALKQPVKHYSSGMRARLAFGLSLAIEFDCYLIDELVAVGDARFQQKCQEELFERRAHRSFMMASHDTHLIARHCDRALIIESGKAKLFDDINEAVEVYTWLRAA